MGWFEDRGIPRCEDSVVLLNIPDVRQAGDHDCGNAAAGAVLAFHKVTATPRLATASHGTDPVQIEQYFRGLGFRVAAGEMRVEDLKHYCDNGRPVICLVHWPEGSDSHFVTVRGISRGWAYIMCPQEGSQKCRVADFEAAWRADGRLSAFHQWAVCPWLP